MKKNLLLCLVLAVGVGFCSVTRGNRVNTETPHSSIKKFEGFTDFHYDGDKDKIILEVGEIKKEFLYVNYLATGIGSNDIGLDRGQKGDQKIVKFVRAGNKLLLMQPNYGFRAESDNPDERRSVEEAFARSVLWGFVIQKEREGKYYIDATDFFIRDAHNVIGRLDRSRQGSYRLDKSRSAFYLPRIKNFPKNSEFEVTLTFTGKPEGRHLRGVAPSADSVTVRQHHSFVQLPDDQYTPREYDPRSGFYARTYHDYGSKISEPLKKRFITRHRLKKKDPEARVSGAVKPIVYYLDRGAPEPIRSALLEGGRWWNGAFEAIGFKNAFDVQLLPEGADPLDIRYNMIQWVHRSTRGWSYGSTVTDPRTGEILKGHVTIGSLRVRQDFLIAIGLLGPYKIGNEIPREAIRMALARIRQLSAHEIGHAMGLTHNYISSSEGRTSVMDYPHPLAEIKDGKIVLDNAYDDRIGLWDKVAIAYGYQNFPDGTDKKKALNYIIENSLKKGINFLSDSDARPAGSVHPRTHLWDNGANAIRELKRIMKIRALALKNFGKRNIPNGVPYATLEGVLTPVYFFHRYQAEAVSKTIGGMDYRFALRGDGQFVTRPVPPKDQLQALEVLLETLTPDALSLPEHVLKLIPPGTLDYVNNREVIESRTGPAFDALGAAETMANMVLDFILHPQRAGRLLEYHVRDSQQPGLAKVLDRLIDFTWKGKHKKGYHGEIQRVVDNVLLRTMMKLTVNPKVSANVKAITFYKLAELRKWLKGRLSWGIDKTLQAHFSYAENRIRIFQENPSKYIPEPPLKPPAGSPIGN